MIRKDKCNSISNNLKIIKDIPILINYLTELGSKYKVVIEL